MGVLVKAVAENYTEDMFMDEHKCSVGSMRDTDLMTVKWPNHLGKMSTLVPFIPKGAKLVTEIFSLTEVSRGEAILGLGHSIHANHSKQVFDFQRNSSMAERPGYFKNHGFLDLQTKERIQQIVAKKNKPTVPSNSAGSQLEAQTDTVVPEGDPDKGERRSL